MAINFESEPNNEESQATEIPVDDTLFGGQLQSASDQDWFKFDYEVSAEEGATNTFEFLFTSPITSDGTSGIADSFRIRIVSPDGNESTFYTDANQAGIFAAPTSGTYYVLVESGGNWFVDEGQSLQYGLQIKPSEKYAEIEANNAQVLANEASFGREYVGQIAVAGDSDYFRYTAESAGLVTISFDMLPVTDDGEPGTAQYNISVIDGSSGHTLTSFYTSDDVPNLDFWAPSAGDYYVVVTHGGQWNEENYTLKLTSAATSSGAEPEESIIQGGNGNDLLQGSVGDDIINGGLGADVMYGSTGDDAYYVDNKKDRPIEVAGEGSKDVVYVNVNGYTLPASIEKLIMEGTPVGAFGNSENNTMIGNDLNNVLNGKDGNDTLDGGKGADKMIGGLGDDTYHIDNSLDRVVETGPGIDIINSAIDVTKLDGKIENVSLTGTAVQAIGNKLDNVLTGNELTNNLSGGSGSDTIFGKSGNDSINGGVGIDTLFGDDGSDAFIFDVTPSSANYDNVKDFQSGTDKLWLSHSVYKNFGVGSVSSDQLLIYSTPEELAMQDANDYLVFNQADGTLYYDADGSGAGSMLIVAKLAENGTLQSTDFFVY